MTGLVTKAQVLSIYKQLLRESQKFESYNFRWVLILCNNQSQNRRPFVRSKKIKSEIEYLFVWMFIFRNYALRRIKDAFKENKALGQADQVQQQFRFANENLDIIKRQVSLCHIEIVVVDQRFIGFIFLENRWLLANCIPAID